MKARIVRSLALTLTLTQLTLALPLVVEAAPAASEKDEARERFDRGLKLFNEGDNPGALAEFKRAYELIPNQLVLYNIGLVYAAMNRPAEATDALTKVLADPGSLSSERLQRAKQTREEQATRVAELTITTSVPATIEIDNVEAGKTPLSGPLRVASGTRIVGAFATGYAPLRKEVTVAGGTKTEIKLELAAMEGKAAHLALHTHLPAADVLVDGQVVGKTPLATSLTVAPGTHKIGLKREGYLTAQQDLTLGDGASGDVSMEPEVDSAALATGGGSLALEISEAQAVVTIDGKLRGTYAGSFKLPKGLHQLVVERGGFEPSERGVTVDTNRTTTVPISLVPTPETRAAFVSHANTQRTWGWVATLGGLALAGGGVTLLVLDSKSKSDANATIDDVLFRSVAKSLRDCDPSTGDKPECQATYDAALKKYNDAQTRDKFGYVMAGVGGVSAALGLYLLISNDSPHRYDRKSDDSPLSLRVLPVVGGTNGLMLFGSY